MAPFVSLAVQALTILDFLVHWGLGWRYLFSSSFRQQVRQRPQVLPKSVQVAETIMTALAFIIINAIIVAVLWRILVGPLRPIHEWWS